METFVFSVDKELLVVALSLHRRERKEIHTAAFVSEQIGHVLHSLDDVIINTGRNRSQRIRKSVGSAVVRPEGHKKRYEPEDKPAHSTYCYVKEREEKASEESREEIARRVMKVPEEGRELLFLRLSGVLGKVMAERSVHKEEDSENREDGAGQQLPEKGLRKGTGAVEG